MALQSGRLQSPSLQVRMGDAEKAGSTTLNLQRRASLPLPEGEGRGEGERNARTVFSRRDIGQSRSFSAKADRNVRALGRRAFTLIELLLVMALLVIVLGVSIPSLKGFFKGRTLDSEAKRFLALTRHGQSRAVSEGLPMVLWIDPREGQYGLQAAAGYLETDTNSMQFTVDKGLTIEVSRMQQTNFMRSTIRSTLGSSSELQPVDLQRNFNEVSMIQFLPDGFITDTSPENIVFRENDEFTAWIARSRNRLNYAIQTNQLPYDWR